jgi:hypothetical protein
MEAMQTRLGSGASRLRGDSATGDVILPQRLESGNGFFALHATAAVLADFMKAADRNQGEHASRGPFGASPGPKIMALSAGRRLGQ